MSLADRLDRIVTPQLDDWVRHPDIHARLVHFDLPLGLVPFPSSSPSANEYPRSIRSISSSMALCIHHSNPSTCPSTHPPSLLSHYANTDATPTETSLNTNLADQFPGLPLLEDNNGVLERPAAHIMLPVYECTFWFLGCGYISCDADEWTTHCLSHFRGEEPPRSVQCPLCEWAVTCDHGWSARMQHIEREHAIFGQTLRLSRPDFALYRWLWQRKLIGDGDLKELLGGNHNLERGLGNGVVTHGREGRRGEARRRVVQHVSVASRRQAGPV
ncbi:hypothetical protein P153DRAFT_365779 [Dothidotthia symphoricarpi CBS 119687]|uniref:Uncharacterized protein n=1 Tax=Dothidotthia symphoricarpi CBS 119687 TaxID=1392245 RepID=A0A6A6AGR8_9PLEO|nr:uncharacterized protein P153DRAFT_365779 [Dothidotthia symphoricarpi CBS 119687]KAF2131182.1 hypothetical protein P153DRAFT_365779 [Dothidotthia symphoricarpi CBS 119687]